MFEFGKDLSKHSDFTRFCILRKINVFALNCGMLVELNSNFVWKYTNVPKMLDIFGEDRLKGPDFIAISIFFRFYFQNN